MNDPIADMLTRIRNATLARKATLLVPFSRLKFALAKILEKEKYLQQVEIVENGFKFLKITLRYIDRRPAINQIKKISKGGQRIYVKKEDLPRVLNNFGLAIISTSRGLMTNKEARYLGLGGEVICEIY